MCNMCEPRDGATSARRVDRQDAVFRDDSDALRMNAGTTCQEAVEAVARGATRDAVDAAASEAKAAQQAAVTCDVSDLVEAAAAAVEVDMEDAQAANSATKRKADLAPCGDLVPARAASDVTRADAADQVEDSSAKPSKGVRKYRRVLLAQPPAFGLQLGPCATTSDLGVPVLWIPPALRPAYLPRVFARKPEAIWPRTMPSCALPSTLLHAVGPGSSSAPLPNM